MKVWYNNKRREIGWTNYLTDKVASPSLFYFMRLKEEKN